MEIMNFPKELFYWHTLNMSVHAMSHINHRGNTWLKLVHQVRTSITFGLIGLICYSCPYDSIISNFTVSSTYYV